MFNGASSFTSDLSGWDVSSVTHMGVRCIRRWSNPARPALLVLAWVCCVPHSWHLAWAVAGNVRWSQLLHIGFE